MSGLRKKSRRAARSVSRGDGGLTNKELEEFLNDRLDQLSAMLRPPIIKGRNTRKAASAESVSVSEYLRYVQLGGSAL